jgi:hypothetical protein
VWSDAAWTRRLRLPRVMVQRRIRHPHIHVSAFLRLLPIDPRTRLENPFGRKRPGAWKPSTWVQRYHAPEIDTQKWHWSLNQRMARAFVGALKHWIYGALAFVNLSSSVMASSPVREPLNLLCSLLPHPPCMTHCGNHGWFGRPCFRSCHLRVFHAILCQTSAKTSFFILSLSQTNSMNPKNYRFAIILAIKWTSHA